MLIGPEFLLHRAGIDADVEVLGQYNQQVDVSYPWADQGKEAGSTVDPAYVKVRIQNGLFDYNDGTGATSSNGSDHKIKFAFNLVGKPGLPLDARFNGRDVQVGDALVLSGVSGSVNYTAQGTIIGFEDLPGTASVGAATEKPGGNVSNSAASAPAIAPIGTTPNSMTVGGTYEGRVAGVPTETYTLTVVRGTTGSNPSTGVFNLVSQSGADTVLGFVPAATSFGTPFPIGQNGLNVTINVGAADLIAGQSWDIEVSEAYTKPTVASSGTYTGGQSTGYIVSVVRGGDVTDPDSTKRPRLSISTTTGYDSVLPFTVPQTALNAPVVIAVGHFGAILTITFAAGTSVLMGNDQWIVPVTSAASGPRQIAVLDRAIDPAMIPLASMDFKFCVVSTLDLPQTLPTLGLTNWDADTTAVTLHAGAQAFPPNWKSGTEALELVGGDILVTWRELVINNSLTVQSMGPGVSVSSAIATQATTADNPLGRAIELCQENTANGGSVQVGLRFISVKSNDAAGYTAALKILENRNDGYFIVPLTYDQPTLDLVVAHVAAMSQPEKGKWRVGFYPSKYVPVVGLVTVDANGNDYLATVNAQRVLTSQTVGVNFIASGLRSGDTVRIAYTSSTTGTISYSEFTIDRVLSATQLSLLTAPGVLATPLKFEVWRTQNSDDLVTAFSAQAAHYNSRRAALIFPDQVPSSGEILPSYFLAAAVAGLAGSIPPQQGLSTLPLSGFDGLNWVNDTFGDDQLNTMAGNGVFICWQDIDTNAPAVRHQLMTLTDDLLNRELSMVKNADSISYVILNRMKPYRGRVNVTRGTLDAIRGDIQAAFSYLESTDVSPLLGGQLLPGSQIITLRQHALLKDTVVIVLGLNLPAPLNYQEITLAFAAATVTL